MITARWLGHSTYLFGTSSGKKVLVDPFLTDNPKTPDSWKSPDQIDFILLTHGHMDHAADAIPIAKKTGAKVVSIVELSALLKEDGLPEEQAVEMNKGGTVDLGDFKATMTNANHSNSWNGKYAGDPAGFILHFGNFKIYHAGDTNIMPDFKIYRKLYRPDMIILPIGDYYTMGPSEAAYACNIMEPRFAVPMHYGTMPILTGTPEEFISLVEKYGNKKTKIIVPEPGKEFMGSLDI